MWLFLALTTAFCYGLRGIGYQWSSQKPMDRNLMLLGVFITGLVVSVIAIYITGQVWSKGALIGILIGTCSFLSNGAMYKGFSVGKASIIAIFSSLPPVIVIILAYIIWGEKLNLSQMVAFLIIIMGIIMIRYSSNLSLKNLGGIQWGLLVMLFFGLSEITSKQAMLWEADIFPTMVMSFSWGSILFGIIWLKNRARKDVLAKANQETTVNGPLRWKAIRTFQWGMLGLAFMLLAFAAGPTGLVSVIVGLSVLVILFYVRFFLKEKFNRMELLGISFSLLGVVLLRLLGS
jgi:drug/metabolite transporter (DMT)-like permease